MFGGHDEFPLRDRRSPMTSHASILGLTPRLWKLGFRMRPSRPRMPAMSIARSSLWTLLLGLLGSTTFRCSYTLLVALDQANDPIYRSTRRTEG
jgi:hypothetical protein